MTKNFTKKYVRTLHIKFRAKNEDASGRVNRKCRRATGSKSKCQMKRKNSAKCTNVWNSEINFKRKNNKALVIKSVPKVDMFKPNKSPERHLKSE